jgi:hypothetical protein
MFTFRILSAVKEPLTFFRTTLSFWAGGVYPIVCQQLHIILSSPSHTQMVITIKKNKMNLSRDLLSIRVQALYEIRMVYFAVLRLLPNQRMLGMWPEFKNGCGSSCGSREWFAVRKFRSKNHVNFRRLNAEKMEKKPKESACKWHACLLS